MKKQSEDFLLEIHVEDLPALHIKAASESLKAAFIKEFDSLSIDYTLATLALDNLATKNRLICYIKDISAKQKGSSQEVIGPPKRIAFDEKGNPTKQALGFAKNQGVKVGDLKIKQTPKGEYIVIEKKTKARNTKDILKEITPCIIKKIYFPKTMKWDSSGLEFARPITSVLLLFGEDNININLGNVSQKKISGSTPAEYLVEIQKKVIINYTDRKEKIKKLILGVTKKLKADGDVDSKLLEEVTFMVDSPLVFAGGFDKKFLALPKEVLIASMAKYQRVFSVLKKGQLINKFIAVIDGPGRDIKLIRKNYENILEAKLKDSLFFFEEDTKHTLSKQANQLKELIFQKDLGNMFEKIERLKELSLFISRKLDLKDSQRKNIGRAAELSKADLVTHMVGEFPSLQGLVGREYALKSGEEKIAAVAIGEHYLPQGMDDKLPSSDEGAVLAIADKIDNLVGFSGMMIEKISGSFDPFGIRRNALGIIRIIKDRSFRFKIDEAIQKAIELYGDKLKINDGEFKGKIIDFVNDRIEFLMGEVRPIELKKAVLGSNSPDIANIFERKEVLASISNERYFLEAAKVVERTSNILKGAKGGIIGQVDKNLFKEDLEKKVWDAYLNKKELIISLINKENYKEATREYAEAFYKVLHEFFDKVLVNAEDSSLRSNRLAIMKAINALYTESIADLALLPQIVVE